jgi:hypothetical protein
VRQQYLGGILAFDIPIQWLALSGRQGVCTAIEYYDVPQDIHTSRPRVVAKAEYNNQNCKPDGGLQSILDDFC